ncbi:uncharacterized protein VICG_01719 [Vittaforma corneae ATCC 50505]|uniref:Uncharacterized protein n=1 Tax=Vittaforma corneae (strain ATCC 50505) TaxID=993615 RepID=L2GL54_VITCO|nr:uncharacterized protein VICG_01719 [Vittaforma corneae ATCC 50505]ELA41230.1 hypothetical protein VICG_01719 [Vittaforma corneae ATCC 50505]
MNSRIVLPVLFGVSLSKHYLDNANQNRTRFSSSNADKVPDSHGVSDKHDSIYVSIGTNPDKTGSYNHPASNSAEIPFTNTDNSIHVFKPKTVSKEIKELKEWETKNIVFIVGTSRVESDNIPEFTKKIKLLIDVDSTIHKKELSQRQDYRNWEDYMENTYQPLFSKYRDVIFKMEKEQIKEMLKLKDNFATANSSNAGTNNHSNTTTKSNAKSSSSKRNRTRISNAFLPFMLDRFYFAKPSAFDLTVNATNLLLTIVGSEDLSKEEMNELKRRFVMTQFKDSSPNGNIYTSNYSSTLWNKELSRSEIREIMADFDLSSVMDSLKEYFDFMKRLGKIVNIDKEYSFVYPVLNIEDFEESEKNILVECSEVFEGYLQNVKGIKGWIGRNK